MINRVRNNKKGFTFSNASEKSQKGFTLIETILYFALLSIILLIVVDLFFKISEISLESSNKSAVEIEGEYVLNRFAYDIHRFDNSNGDTLLAPLDPGDTTPWLVMNIGGINYTYISGSISTGEPTIVFGNLGIDSDRLTSNSVVDSVLTFTHIGNLGGKPTIKINFTLESTTPSKDGTFETRDFESVFSVR